MGGEVAGVMPVRGVLIRPVAMAVSPPPTPATGEKFFLQTGSFKANGDAAIFGVAAQPGLVAKAPQTKRAL